MKKNFFIRKTFPSRIELDEYFDSFAKIFVCNKIRRVGSNLWVSKFEDPCINCNSKNCRHKGKPFIFLNKLIVLEVENEE